jgi:hypothetical protein
MPAATPPLPRPSFSPLGSDAFRTWGWPLPLPGLLLPHDLSQRLAADRLPPLPDRLLALLGFQAASLPHNKRQQQSKRLDGNE